MSNDETIKNAKILIIDEDVNSICYRRVKSK